MKKVIKFVAAALIMISSVSMMSAISGDAVYAKAHYPSFTMPKKYRGTWKMARIGSRSLRIPIKLMDINLNCIF